MTVYALALIVLTAGWAHAELRRREAERERDALRADAVRLLLRLHELTGHAEARIREHHGLITQWQALHGPGAGELQEAASSTWSAREVAEEGLRLLDRRSHGRVGR